MRSTFHTSATSHEHACRMLEALCEGYVLAMLEEFDAYPEGEFPCCIKCGGFATRNAPLTPCQIESIEETLEHGHPVSGLQRHRLAEILTAHGHDALSVGTREEMEHTEDPQVAQQIAADHLEEDPAYYSKLAAAGLRNAGGAAQLRQPATALAAATGVPISAWRVGVKPGPMQRSRPGAVRVRSARQILRNKGGHTVDLACYQCAMKRRTGADPGAKVIICCTVPGTFRGAVLMSEQHSKPERRGRIDDPVVDARPIGPCACALPEAG